ncbi:MAG: signal peptidase II [Azospirillaceae bacterium]|nr:signal peptidase II [Azospirillaceae bacterium]
MRRRQGGRSRFALGLGIAALVVALDQLSKWALLTYVMAPPHTVAVTSFFNLVLAWNRGISFSLMPDGGGLGPYLLSGLALVIAAGLLVWLRGIERVFLAAAIGLVLGGAVGNVIDRLRFGAVTDFLDFHLFGWHWYAFNVADSGISVGVALILIDGLFHRPRPA